MMKYNQVNAIYMRKKLNHRIELKNFLQIIYIQICKDLIFLLEKKQKRIFFHSILIILPKLIKMLVNIAQQSNQFTLRIKSILKNFNKINQTFRIQ